MIFNIVILLFDLLKYDKILYNEGVDSAMQMSDDCKKKCQIFTPKNNAPPYSL